MTSMIRSILRFGIYGAQRCSLAVVVIALLGVGTMSGRVNAAPSLPPHTLKTMTWNADNGTDLGFVFRARSPQELRDAVSDTWKEVQASGLEERMAAIAHTILDQQPDLVSLQELYTYRTGPLNRPPATNVVYGQLAMLLAELNRQGEQYRVVGADRLSDEELPSSQGIDVRSTDRDVMLARVDSNLQIDNVRAEPFATLLTRPLPESSFLYKRGYVSADVSVRGRSFRFIDLHLEGSSVEVQNAQGRELVRIANETAFPTILAGDFNSAATGGPQTPTTYRDLISAGFVDTWAVAHPDLLGLTVPLHLEDPYTPKSDPTARIDLILTRPGVDVVDVHQVGSNEARDLTPSGFWPSDHAGVVAALTLPGATARASSSQVGPLRTSSFTVAYTSTNRGQGLVRFGMGPGCLGLVGTATRDASTGDTRHSVLVEGNDLPGTIGAMPIEPGSTYWYRVETASPKGIEIDDNDGKCYRVTTSS